MLQMTASSPRPKHHAITNTEDLHQDDPKLHKCCGTRAARNRTFWPAAALTIIQIE